MIYDIIYDIIYDMIYDVIYDKIHDIISYHIIIGPSGVRALPLADGTNEGGHSTWHYFAI